MLPYKVKPQLHYIGLSILKLTYPISSSILHTTCIIGSGVGPGRDSLAFNYIKTIAVFQITKKVYVPYTCRLVSMSMDALGVEVFDKDCSPDPPLLASLSRKEIQASVNDSLSSSSGTPVGLIHPLGLGVWPPPGEGLLLDRRINPICSLCSSDSWRTLAITLRISYRLRSPLGATKKPTMRLVISCLESKRSKLVAVLCLSPFLPGFSTAIVTYLSTLVSLTPSLIRFMASTKCSFNMMAIAIVFISNNPSSSKGGITSWLTFMAELSN